MAESFQAPAAVAKYRTAEVADFEEAIALTGHGRFNYLLILMLVAAMSSQVFLTTDMAFILPAAECDMGLDDMKKGIINASLYAGMITFAFLWGAMADALGRRRLLLLGYFGCGVLQIASGIVQQYWALVLLRFLSGAMIIGPVGIVMTYAAELHGQQYRSRILMWTGMFQAFAGALQAALAMLVVPRLLPLASWRVFLVLCSAPSLFSSALFLILPESPKFLVARGRDADALKVFRRLYASNTGNKEDQFPVKVLVTRQASIAIVPEVPGSVRQPSKIMRPLYVIATQFKVLFRKPHVTAVALGLAVQFLLLFCSNSVRMWVPQIFTQLQEMEHRDEMRLSSGLEPPDILDSQERHLCAILDATHGNDNSSTGIQACVPRVVSASVYLNSVVIGLTQAITNLLAGFIIPKTGDKSIMVACLLGAGSACAGWLWASNSATTLVLAATFQSFTSIANCALINAIVDLFPTSIRSSAVSMTNTFGRLGSLFGNLVFPTLLTACCPASFGLAACCLAASAVIGLFLPKADRSPDSELKDSTKTNQGSEITCVTEITHS